MKTLEEPKARKLDGRTLEAQIASWYKPPPVKTVLTEELAIRIAENFLDGFTDEETAEMCNVDPMTLRKWRNLSVIRNHERNRKKFYIHEVRDGKRRDWTRLAWWLERRYPLEFSRPEVAHAISTSIHTTVNTTQNLIVSSELAEQLAERNAKIAGKIEQLFANRSSTSQVISPSLEEPRIDNALTSDAYKVRDKVREIVVNTTPIEDVVNTPNDDKSSPIDPPFRDPAGGTPLVVAGAPTDQLSPLPDQKTNKKPVKGFEVIPDIKGESEKSDALARRNFDQITKNFDVTKKVHLAELEGQVVKTKTKSAPPPRARMEEEIKRRSRETKLNRAALRVANKAADKLHPRRAHK